MDDERWEALRADIYSQIGYHLGIDDTDDAACDAKNAATNAVLRLIERDVYPPRPHCADCNRPLPHNEAEARVCAPVPFDTARLDEIEALAWKQARELAEDYELIEVEQLTAALDGVSDE